MWWVILFLSVFICPGSAGYTLNDSLLGAFWLAPMMWCSILFLLWTISFLIPDIVPKNAVFEIKRFRIRMIKDEAQDASPFS